ncbi:L-2,4-diaminobutyrate decarboxylase [Roseimaritima multifibrata]|uniref:L-2,4-diaminobutyrate decarboxylase n=1 Tax=Roseimaritima multifibrata TaxID=1930274 RepID=A0A517MIL9_9BACT|nr:pyridoxal-dependent decarboxylase [Roseimaritima multifibrata]QDS94739.1 L-2,4-diaminobutyrate decarboxylase [Roseimaritima multifibrata]
MTKSRDSQSQGFREAKQAVRNLPSSAFLTDLDSAGSRAVEAWFLGPKGENADELEKLVVQAVRDQAFWRRNFHPNDPTHISEEIKRTDDYVEAQGALREGFEELLAFLKKSVPFFSMRYQGHMNWDTTIPGILGYFAAMLYNPNNVAFEGSTATTILELLVGDDLCQMLGYRIPSEDESTTGAIRPWGHITCDGTVANIEAIWSARNLKFYPIALQKALQQDVRLGAARGLRVRLPTGGEENLVSLSLWQLLNLHADEVLAIPTKLELDFGIDGDVVADAVAKFSLQSLGMYEYGRLFSEKIAAPVFFVPGTKHYSFPKAAALLGMGADNVLGGLRDVAVDLDARLDVNQLRKQLQGCLEAKTPVVAVVAVVGTTEESSIDPIDDIIALRDEFAAKGLVFHVHADAAWGGYHRTVINESFDLPSPAFAAGPPLSAPLSNHSAKHLAALGRTDSITVDPHKSGYIPYPAGALCYRNSAMRDLVTFSAPVVFHGDAEPTVGIYGVEGSKPGAAAASVYLSHRVIRPTRHGYGKIIGQALFSCRKLYARLLTMAKEDDRFVVVPIPRLPSERANLTDAQIQVEIEKIRRLVDQMPAASIVNLDTDQVLNPEAMALLQEIGPDQNILAYAFNFKNADGTLNTSLPLANALNKEIYGRLSIDPGQDIYGYDLIVSTTDLERETYGDAFIEDYKRRLGVGQSAGDIVTVLRSVVMDPWVTETSKGSFIDVLEAEFRKAVNGALETVQPMQSRGY